MAEKEAELLKILSNAFNAALKGADLEAEALDMAGSLGEDGMSVKLKILEAKENSVYAQMLKEKAESEFGGLLGKYNDFDLLRNQVTTLCIDVFSVPKQDRQSYLAAKKSARKKGAELIEKLEKELQ